MINVDRKNPLPLYAQLERAVQSYISENGLKPGDPLPTEVKIAEMFAVSRATIRQALMRLVADGQIERVQGLGSFVARPMPSHKSLLTSFSENMRAQGFTPERRILHSEIVGTPDDVVSVFGPEVRECLSLGRILSADGRTVGITQTWIPKDVLSGRLDLFGQDVLGNGSLYDLLQGAEVGLRLQRGTEVIYSGAASEAEAELLECTPNSPTLIVRRIAYTPSDRPVEFTVMTFVGDRYKYSVDLRPKQID